MLCRVLYFSFLLSFKSYFTHSEYNFNFTPLHTQTPIYNTPLHIHTNTYILHPTTHSPTNLQTIYIVYLYIIDNMSNPYITQDTFLSCKTESKTKLNHRVLYTTSGKVQSITPNKTKRQDKL